MIGLDTSYAVYDLVNQRVFIIRNKILYAGKQYIFDAFIISILYLTNMFHGNGFSITSVRDMIILLNLWHLVYNTNDFCASKYYGECSMHIYVIPYGVITKLLKPYYIALMHEL